MKGAWKEKSSVMSTFAKHFIPLDFMAQCCSSYGEGEQWMMRQVNEQWFYSDCLLL